MTSYPKIRLFQIEKACFGSKTNAFKRIWDKFQMTAQLNKSPRFFVFIFLLLIIHNSIASTIDQTCDEELSDRFEFDQNLFNELNMQVIKILVITWVFFLFLFWFYFLKETLVTWYRSCYKTELPKVRKIARPNFYDNGCKQRNTTEVIQAVLFEIFIKDNEIFPPEFYEINKLCDEKFSKQLNVLDKLELLSKFRHNLCGHVYRNSIKLSYLQKYILKSREEYSNVSSLSNNSSSNALRKEPSGSTKTKK